MHSKNRLVNAQQMNGIWHKASGQDVVLLVRFVLLDDSSMGNNFQKLPNLTKQPLKGIGIIQKLK